MSMIRSCLNVLIAFLLIAMSAADDECVAIETMVPSSTQPRLPEEPCDSPELAPASPKFVIPMEELSSSYDSKDAPFPITGRVASMDAPPSSLTQGPSVPLQAISPEPAAIGLPTTGTAASATYDAEALSAVPVATRLQMPASSPGFSKRASPPPVSDVIFVQSRQSSSAARAPLKHGSLITNGVQTVPTGRAITRRKMKKVPINVAVYVKVPEKSRLRDVPSADYDKVYGKIGPLIANGNNPAFMDQQYSVPTLKANNRQPLTPISTVNPVNFKSNFPSVANGPEITNNNLIDYRASTNVNNLQSNFPSIVNGAQTTTNDLNDYRNANTRFIVRDNTDVNNNVNVKNNVDNNVDQRNTNNNFGFGNNNFENKASTVNNDVRSSNIVDQRNTNNNVGVNNNFENKASTVNNDVRSSTFDDKVNTNEANSNTLNSNSDVTNIASNTVNKTDINVNDVASKNSDNRETSNVQDTNVNTVNNTANVNSSVKNVVSISQGSQNDVNVNNNTTSTQNVNDVNVNNNAAGTKNVNDVTVSNKTMSITNINGVSSDVVGSDNNGHTKDTRISNSFDKSVIAKNFLGNNAQDFDSAAHFQSSNVINGGTTNDIRQDTGANSPKKQQLQQSNMIHSTATTIINMKQDQSNSFSDGPSGGSMLQSQTDASKKNMSPEKQSMSPEPQSRTESQMRVNQNSATISHN